MEGALDGYTIDDGKLATLAASRSGRVALAGFEYQRAFAVLRLAALTLRQPVPGCDHVPQLLRYEWAEDIDELCADGSIVLWQCKHGDDWHSPAPLAEVLLGFAPKWLWTPQDQRHRLAFRLVTSDCKFAQYRDQLGPLPVSDALRKAFLSQLAQSPGPRTDRARWQDEADAVGHAVLFEALRAETRVACVPGPTVADPRLWTAERHAVDALAQARRVANPGPAVEIAGALRLLLDVHTTRVPAPDGTIDRIVLAPRWLRPYEVEYRLTRFSPAPAIAQLDVVDRTRLERLLTEPPGQAYVARRPEWSDVVRGADRDLRFLERAHTEALEGRLREALTASLRREGGLRFLPVLGAPGAGKSTLALRVAAKLVLEGHCVAVDLRHPLDGDEDTASLVEALRALGESPQPVLLVLDDPLGADSGWPRVLHVLGRQRAPIVALAATPTFLHDRHRSDLRSPVQELEPLTLPRPDPEERKSLAELYPEADAQRIADSEEEMLVLAMQAATGTSFDAIIDGLWSTLADGQPVPRDALGASLPWPVAAFALVCWFHRAYVPCPLPLLQAFLAKRQDVGEDAEERLRTMTLKQGWRIFQIQEWQGDPRFAYQGGSVTTMHARVAQRAWELRPAPGWNLEQAIAQASAACPAVARPLGAALAGLHRYAPETAKRVLTGMAAGWGDAANAAIETRYLYELATPLNIDRIRVPSWLTGVLLQRAQVNDADSWLAALSLYHLSHRSAEERHFPNDLPLQDIIHAGDFSISPSRASIFATALGEAHGLKAHFMQQLWSAFEEKLAWKLDSTLLTWLLTKDNDGNRIRGHLESIRSWLQKHPEDTYFRTRFMRLLGKLKKADRDEAIRDLRAWLRQHPDDTSVRTKFIDLLGELNATDRANFIEELRNWMEDHPDDTSVRTKFIGLLGVLDETDRAIAHRDIQRWLRAHPEDSSVRSAFLSFESSQKISLLEDADVDEGLQWLSRHPQDANVRTSLISLLLRRNDHRLPDLLAETLRQSHQYSGAYAFASVALKACASLRHKHLNLSCDWLDWASATLSERQGNHSAQTIATSTKQAAFSIKRHIDSGASSVDERARARNTLARLEAALEAWYASIGQQPALPR